MAPQKFADLGKEARDLINKNFHFGALKLEVNTKAGSGIAFKTEGNHNTDTGNVAASLETKFKYAPYGVSFTKKWNTDNVISSTIGVENKLLDGLKVDLDSSWAIVTGKRSVKVKTAYQSCDYYHGTLDVDFAGAAGPTALLSNVVAYQGFHAGHLTSFDIANSKFLNNDFSLAYKQGDLVIHAGVVNASKYVGSIHQQVNKDVSAAALLEYASASGTSLTLCAKYAYDEHTTLKWKVDNNFRSGCTYIQNIRPGIQLTASGLVNLKALDQGGHKIGIGLNFDA